MTQEVHNQILSSFVYLGHKRMIVDGSEDLPAGSEASEVMVTFIIPYAAAAQLLPN